MCAPNPNLNLALNLNLNPSPALEFFCIFQPLNSQQPSRIRGISRCLPANHNHKPHTTPRSPASAQPAPGESSPTELPAVFQTTPRTTKAAVSLPRTGSMAATHSAAPAPDTARIQTNPSPAMLAAGATFQNTASRSESAPALAAAIRARRRAGRIPTSSHTDLAANAARSKHRSANNCAARRP